MPTRSFRRVVTAVALVTTVLAATAQGAAAESFDVCQPLLSLKGGEQVILGVCVSGGLNPAAGSAVNVMVYRKDSENSPMERLTYSRTTVTTDEQGRPNVGGKVDVPGVGSVWYNFVPTVEETLGQQTLCVGIPSTFPPEHCVLPQEVTP